jgi:hypothetical protein
VLTTFIGQRIDATLQEACAYLEAKTGRHVSGPTMSRTLQRMNLPRKKNSTGPGA